jgi:hypothetical protein
MTPKCELRRVIRRKCRSAESLATYERIVLREIGHPLTQKRLKSWWDRVAGNGLGPGSLRLRAAVCRSVLAALAEDGDDDAGAALSWFRRSVTVPMPNASVLAHEPLTDEEWDRIYDAMPGERARLLLLVIRFTAFRVSTALALGRGNLFRKPDGCWLSTTTKRGRRIENPIPTDLAESLLRLDEPWFPWSRQAFSMMLRRRSEWAASRAIGPHLLRKRAVTKHWQATHDLAATAKFAGHSNPALTAALYILPDLAQKRKVVDAL